MNFREKIFPALLAIPSIAICGAFVGALVASRVLPSPGDGWDQIAQALGGLMLGTLVGTVLAIGVVLRASARRLWQVAGSTSLIALLLLTLVYLHRPPRETAPEPGARPGRALPTTPAADGPDSSRP